MKRVRFTEEQIIGVLKEHETGIKTLDLCRKHGISSACFYKWTPGGSRRLRMRPEGQREAANAKLKRMLAESMLDNVALKDLLSKKW
jgi:putative transposase